MSARAAQDVYVRQNVFCRSISTVAYSFTSATTSSDFRDNCPTYSMGFSVFVTLFGSDRQSGQALTVSAKPVLKP